VRSGAASTPGSGGFWCRYLVRFRRVPVQVLGEVPEGYGEDNWLGSRGFWCRGTGEVPDFFRCSYLMRFRRL